MYKVDGQDSRLFTEINFFEHLILNDLVMIFKVFKEITPGIFEKERVIPNYKEKVKHRFYKAFAVVNLFDLLIQDQINFGTSYKLGLLLFYEL